MPGMLLWEPGPGPAGSAQHGSLAVLLWAPRSEILFWVWDLGFPLKGSIGVPVRVPLRVLWGYIEIVKGLGAKNVLTETF